MKKRKTLIIIILISLLLIGCDNPRYFEFDHIRYNGIDYCHERIVERGNDYKGEYTIIDGIWAPITEKKNEKVKIEVIDYSDNIVKGNHYAEAYEDDDENIFLYYFGVLYFREDYIFPDIDSENTMIEKIILTDNNGEEYLIDENKYVNLFMSEYIQKGDNISDYNEESKQYEITICPLNFVACRTSGTITTNAQGTYGFRRGSTNFSRYTILLSEDLNNYIEELFE